MSTKILFAGAIVVLLGSCSSVYKTGQTPDDVYYSPSRPVSEKRIQDDYSYTRPDDNYLRMKVQNRYYWNTIDDRDYWYSYDHNCRCNNNWGVYNKWSYNSWDTWCNWNRSNNYYGYNSGWGYGYGYPIIYVKAPRSNTGPKPYMGGYTNRSYDNTNIPASNGKSNGNGFGNLLRTIFGGNGNTSNGSSSDSYNRPIRTFDNNSSNSGINSSSGRSSSGSSTNSGRSGRRGG